MSDAPVKLFISWSGPLARAVAEALHEWLPKLFAPAAKPFMSEKDIGAGERGLNVIEAELIGTTFGIVVVTQENQYAQWLNFEAGAMSKSTTPDKPEHRVAPYAVDFAKPTDVQGPIGQFQAKIAHEKGTRELVEAICEHIDLDKDVITDRFEMYWPQLEKQLEDAQAAADEPKAEPEKRDPDDILDEILTHVRELRNVPTADDLWRSWTTVLDDSSNARRLFTVKSAQHAPISEAAREDLRRWKLGQDAKRVEETVQLHSVSSGIPEPTVHIVERKTGWLVTVVFDPETTDEQASRIEALVRLEATPFSPTFRFARVEDS